MNEPEPDRKTCPRCGLVKCLAAFGTRRDGRPRGWCRACERIAQGLRREEPGYRERCRAYEATPEARQRKRQSDRQRRATGKVREYNHRPEVQDRARLARLRYLKSPRGYLVQARAQLAYQIRRARDQERRARLQARLDLVQAELDRLDRARAQGGAA